jgi:ribosomal-protein-alanine N-acetyltransferase
MHPDFDILRLERYTKMNNDESIVVLYKKRGVYYVMNIDKSLQVSVEMKASERLTYRLLNGNDFDLYYKLYTDARVMQYAYHDEFSTEEEARDGFEQVLIKQGEDEEGAQFVVTHKESGSDIGIVDYHIETLHHAGGIYEIGYLVLPEFWGKGFATEMSQSLIDYLFDNFNIHKITASCHWDNKRFEGIMKKLHMKREGVLRKSRYKNRIWADEVKYGLLKENRSKTVSS